MKPPLMPYPVLFSMLLGLAGSACDGTDTGVGPVGPQGDIGPGDISVGSGAVVGSGRMVTDERSPSGSETVLMAGEGTVIIDPGDFGLTVGLERGIQTREGIEIEDLTSSSLALSADGVGPITAVGRTERRTADTGGPAKYVGSDRESGSADVACRDGGEAILWAGNSLEVEVRDSGSVSYYGNPGVTQELSETGSLVALGNR